MEVTGFKPGSGNPIAPAAGQARLAVGERLSMCGKFAINGSGQWRELPPSEQTPTEHEFQAVGPDGRPVATQR